MRISESDYLGLELRNPSHANLLRDTAIFAASAFLEAGGDYDLVTKNEAIKGVWGFLASPYNDNYLFTETAREVIQNIKVSESFDVQILRKLPADETQFFNFLYGKDSAVFCMWSNEVLYVVELSRHRDKIGIRRDVAIASLKGNTKIIAFIDTLIKAIKHLIFLKLTEPEIIHIAAGKKLGVRKEGYYNATPLPVIIVNSTWNKYIVRTEGFGVSGHFRMQRCGKNYADLKLTWIKSYQKHGYVRLPKSELTPGEVE